MLDRDNNEKNYWAWMNESFSNFLKLVESWMPRQILFLIGAILLVLLWIILSRVLRSTNLLYGNVTVTATIFVFLGAIAVEAVTPRLSKGIKYFLFVWIVLKITSAIVYFDTLFVSRLEDTVTIIEYGDSAVHYNVAVNYFEYWSGGNLFETPKEVVDLVDQWGYGYFLGLLFYLTGPSPETGIIVNSFLALIFCLLGYKLFILADLSQKDAQIGLIILSFSPVLWIVSSYLYKDSLLFVIVLACVVKILKMLKEFKISGIFTVMVLLGLLMPLRYSYVFVMFVMIVLGSIYIEPKNQKKKLFASVSYCVLLLLFSLLVDRLAFFNSVGITDVVSYVSTSLQTETKGGHFMTHGLGKNIGINNFYYVLPAKAIYILMIPFPWFGGQSAVEMTEYIISHFDTVYFLLVISLVFVAFLNQKRMSISRERKLLLIIGLFFFLIPLFMFYPARRYISICIPFFLAYALPWWLNKKKVFNSMLFSIGIILIVQGMYYFYSV